MALPSTNRTAWFKASATTNLWVNYQAGAPYHNTTPGDGDEVGVWDDEGGANVAMIWTSSSTNSPNFRSATPLMNKSCLDFNGSNDWMRSYTDNGLSEVDLDFFFNNNAKTLLVSIYIEGVTTNNANVYDNEAVFSDDAGVFGLHLKNNAGTYSINAYNWDGTADVVSLNVSLNKSYVVVLRHDTTLYLDLYDSTGNIGSGSTASGSTTSMVQDLQIGTDFNQSVFYNGRIGEWVTYDAVLSGTDLTDAISYMQGEWTPAAAGGWGRLLALDRNRLVGVT